MQHTEAQYVQKTPVTMRDGSFGLFVIRLPNYFA